MAMIVSSGVSGIGPGDRKDRAMAESPVRISVELEGIEPNDRLQAACDELAAAAAELIEEATGPEVVPYFTAPGDVAGISRGVWTNMQPRVKSWSFGVEREEIATQGSDQTSWVAYETWPSK